MIKQQPTKKRLSLSQETLRSLGDKELKAIVGGYSGPNPKNCITADNPACQGAPAV